MINDKIENLLNAPKDSLNLGDITTQKLNDVSFIYWGDEKIGKLVKGSKIYKPNVDVINSEYLSSENF